MYETLVLDGKSIGVVIPAYEEEARIGATVAGLPDFVDRILVIDDASQDNTSAAAMTPRRAGVTVKRHAENRGVGAAIATGYEALLEEGVDVLVVVAGDNQMDPADMKRVVSPIVQGHADYVKGNRFWHEDYRAMPFLRRLGSRALAFLTRVLSGLSIDDSQCGFTALSASCARSLPLRDLWPRYGYPNDLLLLLAKHGATVAEVPVRPVYAGEKSGLRPYHVILIALVTLRRAFLLAD